MRAPESTQHRYSTSAHHLSSRSTHQTAERIHSLTCTLVIGLTALISTDGLVSSVDAPPQLHRLNSSQTHARQLAHFAAADSSLAPKTSIEMSTSALVSLEELVAVHQPKAKHCTSSEVPGTTTRTSTRRFLYTIPRTSTSYELFDGPNTTTTGGMKSLALSNISRSSNYEGDSRG